MNIWKEKMWTGEGGREREREGEREGELEVCMYVTFDGLVIRE